MKKWILSFGLMALISFGVMAQGQRGNTRPNPEEMAKMMTDRMTKQLNLTKEQQEQVYAIHLDLAQKREEERQARKAETDARKEEAQKHEERLNEVLTEEQRQKWVEIKSERPVRMRPHGEIMDRDDFRKRRGGGN
ncbi:MAG: hypothetical protein CL554_15545 [Algoriphagus sp.]|jgi:Spy/CpxP family protein refolding chaperone|uniref:DUF4890 domain-containing protein n=1 Tax=unclassified Algoriphagus TaxID=2641541 RepID=UPI000C5B319A|nr:MULTISPECIES: DUF4890 domain-containing protein [unclassified Algoriphagus]MAL14833.1 hypothetical protein [Algoriphagus sp.]QYH40739.1 hypothetical protein GYM62_18765 [Algoriphagus sp. NBT04N3]|tara:strand:- start:114 stop:521 length:408 start_codon:yes stop_codon:yes gene_type:complete